MIVEVARFPVPAGMQPALLDDSDQCGILLKRDTGPAEIVGLGYPTLHCQLILRRWCDLLAVCPIASNERPIFRSIRLARVLSENPVTDG
jgi:hypothetical protein